MAPGLVHSPLVHHAELRFSKLRHYPPSKDGSAPRVPKSSSSRHPYILDSATLPIENRAVRKTSVFRTPQISLVRKCARDIGKRGQERPTGRYSCQLPAFLSWQGSLLEHVAVLWRFEKLGSISRQLRYPQIHRFHRTLSSSHAKAAKGIPRC